MDIEKKKRFIIDTLFVAIVLFLIYISIRFLFSYLFPFMIGIVLAYAMQRPSEYIHSKFSVSQSVCAATLVAVTYILIMLLIYGIFALISKNINTLWKFFMDNIKYIAVQFEALYQKIAGPLKGNSNIVFNGSVSAVTEKLTNWISVVATNMAKALPSVIFSMVVTVVASCYIAKDYKKLFKFFKGIISEKTAGEILLIKDIITGSIMKYVAGYLIILLITFTELAIGLLILRVKFAFAIAVAIAVIDLLPVLGTGTVLLPWAIVSIADSNTELGVGLIVLYIVITVIRNFIEPHIIGKKLGLNPIFSLAAMFVGLRLSGFAGMIILPLSLIVIINFYERKTQTA